MHCAQDHKLVCSPWPVSVVLSLVCVDGQKINLVYLLVLLNLSTREQKRAKKLIKCDQNCISLYFAALMHSRKQDSGSEKHFKIN